MNADAERDVPADAWAATDAHFWAAEWAKARNRSSLYSRRNDPEAWVRYWDMVAPSYALRNRQLAAVHRDLVEKLALEGVVTRESIVLDVGSGPGTFALHFAEKAARVVALDPAAGMLRVLRQEAEQRGVSERIVTVLSSWEDFEPEERFDLVFSANSPAVRDYSTLSKMNLASRGYCCLVSSAKGSTLRLRDMLWEKVTGRGIRGGAFDPLYHCDGYYPELRFLRYASRLKERVDVLEEQYKAYFRIFGYDGPETEESIHQCIRSLSVDGWYEDVSEGHLAVIWWRASRC